MEEVNLATALLQFAGVVVVSYTVLWWIIRPLSFVYRIKDGYLVVRTFCFIPIAKIPLTGLIQATTQEPQSGKPKRGLASAYGFPGEPSLFVETESEILILPGWHQGWLGSDDPGAALALARRHRWESRRIQPLRFTGSSAVTRVTNSGWHISRC